MSSALIENARQQIKRMQGALKRRRKKLVNVLNELAEDPDNEDLLVHKDNMTGEVEDLEEEILGLKDDLEKELKRQSGGIVNKDDIHRVAHEELLNVFSRESLRGMLEQARKQIVAKMLGFSDRWHSAGWEIDHCNGRKTDLSAFINSEARKHVHDWLNDSVKPVLEGLPKACMKAAEKDYMSIFKQEFNRQIRDLARNHARDAAQEIAKKQASQIVDDLVKDIIIVHPTREEAEEALAKAIGNEDKDECPF